MNINYVGTIPKHITYLNSNVLCTYIKIVHRAYKYQCHKLVVQCFKHRCHKGVINKCQLGTISIFIVFINLQSNLLFFLVLSDVCRIS